MKEVDLDSNPTRFFPANIVTHRSVELGQLHQLALNCLAMFSWKSIRNPRKCMLHRGIPAKRRVFVHNAGTAPEFSNVCWMKEASVESCSQIHGKGRN